MFERLSQSLSSALRRLAGKGRITEANVREAMAEVRTSLLEADVHVSVVDEFCDQVLERALGQQVLTSLEPAQQMVGIVNDSIVQLLGGEPDGEEIAGIPRVSPGPTVIMMCGLQGSGKTTTCGKLAAYLKKRGRSVMLCAADLQRPAAVEQLHTVTEQVEREMPGGARVEFYAEPQRVAEYGKAVGVAVGVCQRALKAAAVKGVDTLILDTAGRLHVDEPLMAELDAVRRALTPHQIYLVVDAMTGQDAVNSAKAFNERLRVDGVILSKFDSDTRGGAAVSVCRMTGAPIRFVGVGERLEALEEFHPRRAAGRILGMGDVVSLVQKAQEQVSEAEAQRMAEKMAKGRLTVDDFVQQLRSLRRMGPMKQILGMLPGVGSALSDVNIDEKQLDRVEAIVNSMTRQERSDVALLSPSRRRRIARGSGVSIDEVGRFVKQFESMSRFTKQMAGMGAMSKLGAMREMQRAGGVPGVSGLPSLGARRSTHMPSPKSRFKKRR